MDIQAIRTALAGLFGGNAYTTTPTTVLSPYVIVGFPSVEYVHDFGAGQLLNISLEIGTSLQDAAKAESYLASVLDSLTATVLVPNAAWRAITIKSSGLPFNKEYANTAYKAVQVNLEIKA